MRSRTRLAAALALALAGAGCSPAGSAGTAPAGTGIPAAPVASHAGTPRAATTSDAAAKAADAGSDASRAGADSASAPSPTPTREPPSLTTTPAITGDEAETAQFVTSASRSAPEVAACRARKDDKERIRCSIAHLLKDDPRALAAATTLFDKTGSVVGVEVEQQMDGGYRGKLHLVPEPPIGAHRKHLEWVAQAAYDFDVFFDGLAAAAAKPVRYRHRALLLRYFRSVGARTPSAFAYEWTVAYNVSGSLHRTPDAVRETMFHEIFHLNDRAHGGGWSSPALGSIYAGIAARCGTRVPCLAPYAPSETKIRGGTYYAFHPENGVQEYAAELSLRYYREQRFMLLKKPLDKPPFKCGPPENARSWELLRDEFFGGVDLVPPCRGG